MDGEEFYFGGCLSYDVNIVLEREDRGLLMSIIQEHPFSIFVPR